MGRGGGRGGGEGAGEGGMREEFPAGRFRNLIDFTPNQEESEGWFQKSNYPLIIFSGNCYCFSKSE